MSCSQVEPGVEAVSTWLIFAEAPFSITIAKLPQVVAPPQVVFWITLVFSIVTSLASTVIVPVTSSPLTTAPSSETVTSPLGFSVVPFGTPVFEGAGNPQLLGDEKQWAWWTAVVAAPACPPAAPASSATTAVMKLVKAIRSRARQA